MDGVLPLATLSRTVLATSFQSVTASACAVLDPRNATAKNTKNTIREKLWGIDMLSPFFVTETPFKYVLDGKALQFHKTHSQGYLLFFFSSRASHARARLQSRLTVATDTWRASEVSSWLNPPKKRISTIWLFRESIFSSSRRALSSAS